MDKPNIIFILIDDLGWRDLACYGSSFYETPNLDRLAAQGTRFSQAYAASPVCSPTRASLLTGKYPPAVGITNWIGGDARGRLISAPNGDHLPVHERCLAEALKRAGYATWHVGKWHLGGEAYYPEKRGFDVNIGGCHWGSPRNGYFSPWAIPTLENGPPGEYLTDRLTDEAIRLIESRGGRPFFLNLWYYAVHTPIQAKAQLIEKYERKARSMGLDQAQTFAEGEFFPCEHKRERRVVRRLVQSDPAYAAMIENLDHNIGRLLDALHAEGEAGNTLVIFSSDNGGLSTAESSPTCNAPLSEGKGWMYEGGTREPLIVRWPGVTRPGAHTDVPVTSPDFYPTLLEAAGIDPRAEPGVQGVSFLPLLKGAKNLDREAIFWHYPHYSNQGGAPASSVRLGEYKLIEFFEDDRLELYHLGEDISEEHNLAREDRGLTELLRRRLVEWRAGVGALLPSPNLDWKG